MKRKNSVLILLVLIFLVNSCTKVKLTDTTAVKKHLQSYTFEHVEYKANMTSFLQFTESNCDLIIYLDGKHFSTTSYSYNIGELKDDYLLLNIDKNEGIWKLKTDGIIYLINKGEVFIYNYKDIK